MHHIYNTEAVVLGTGAVGEASRAVWLLTADLGLLVARATSAREERSKMRYGLQDFSIVNVSLVRGKAIWRLTGVVLKEQIYGKLQEVNNAKTAVKVFSLIKRLVPNEEKDEVLYKVVLDGVRAFTNAKCEAHIVEFLLVARVLHALGYMPENNEYIDVINSNNYEVKVAPATKALILKDTNEALANADLC